MAAASRKTDAFSMDSHEILSNKQTGNEIDEGNMEAVELLPSIKYDPVEHGPQRESADHESSPGMFGDIRVFRDFFLAAFSDGYHNVRSPRW